MTHWLERVRNMIRIMPKLKRNIDPESIIFQLRPPSLRRDCSRLCVSCGSRAEMFCSRCEVTPYCCAACQRRDWGERHRSVCHNLARPENRESNQKGADGGSDRLPNDAAAPPLAPLRRPHSPATKENVADKQSRVLINSKMKAKNYKDVNNRPQNKTFFNRAIQASHNEPGNEDEWHIGDKEPAAKVDKLVGPKDIQVKKQKAEPKSKFEHRPKEKEKSEKPMSPVKPKPEKVTTEVQPSFKVNPASVKSVTPVKKIAVPKNYVVELLEVGDVVMLSVDALASECRAGNTGFVCLALNEDYGADYEMLCDAFAVACENLQVITPTPGQCFSYQDPTDGGWYRARCLTPTLGALLDAGRLVALTPQDVLKVLPQEYADKPEFCCLLKGVAAQIGDNLKCTVTSKFPECSKVAIQNIDTGDALGQGEISRWQPEVEVSVPTPIGSVAIPEVSRPNLINGSKVMLVEATGPKNVIVRSLEINSQRRYDSALHGASLYGQGATPLEVPPQKGQLVIATYSDGHHYRALCKRTNVKLNKYLLEYVEIGNTGVAKLEDMFPCPPEFDLDALPAEASVATLQCDATVFNERARSYIEALKTSARDLLLTLSSGAESEPSGAEVRLKVALTKESVNEKLDELCTPEWKKMERSGMDAVECPTLMYSDLEYLELPAEGCEVQVLDLSSLEGGTVAGHRRGERLAELVSRDLPKQLEEYCNSKLGKEPYLPKLEELCIAWCPLRKQWRRAVLCEQLSGAGGREALVSFVDEGSVARVGVAALRKMAPDFVRGTPALASHLEIRGFPKEPSGEMLQRALRHMRPAEGGAALLRVARCQRLEGGLYAVDAPGLLAAMGP